MTNNFIFFVTVNINEDYGIVIDISKDYIDDAILQDIIGSEYIFYSEIKLMKICNRTSNPYFSSYYLHKCYFNPENIYNYNLHDSFIPILRAIESTGCTLLTEEKDKIFNALIINYNTICDVIVADFIDSWAHILKDNY